jgi:hypothetical protein
LLEAGNSFRVKLLLPVERGRAVIGQPFPRELFVNGPGEPLCFFEVGLCCFTPDEITVGSSRIPFLIHRKVAQGYTDVLTEQGSNITRKSLTGMKPLIGCPSQSADYLFQRACQLVRHVVS